ncbi:hypothetical protein DIPPA_05952 [Diplonema papillatum]|nr:hypothetical protein DIPPA_05952 [Diplonema papillatum]
MDPGWVFIYLYLALELFVVFLLIVPMPTNAIRGYMIDQIRLIWRRHPYFRYYSGIMLFVSTTYFAAAINFLYSDHTSIVDEKNLRTQFFKEQRNAYLTGFTLFNFLVINRLLELHTQMYDMREELARKKQE